MCCAQGEREPVVACRQAAASATLAVRPACASSQAHNRGSFVCRALTEIQHDVKETREAIAEVSS